MESSGRLKRASASIKSSRQEIDDFDDEDLVDVESNDDNSEDERITKAKKPKATKIQAASKATENEHPNIPRVSKSSSSSSSVMKRKSAVSSTREEEEIDVDDNEEDGDEDNIDPGVRKQSKKPKAAELLDNLLDGLDDDDDDGDILADDSVETEDPESNAAKNKSEAGQIVRIKIENFMCHQKLTVDFCKNVNFITGQNGSGKSAIVAAIQLCLGGSARTTGRGSNTGALIREGSSSPAVLTVTLRNEGEDAFEPEKYGDRIHVRRKINPRGNSEYALLGEPWSKPNKAKGKARDENEDADNDHEEDKNRRAPVIVEGNSSVAKDVLEKLTHQFNICVPNPCCILTQEESKKFINGQDKDKYDFFLKATGLHQTCEMMNLIQADLEAAEVKSETAVGKLTKMREEVAKAKKEKEDADSLLEAEGEIKRLQAKILWKHVHDEEVVVEKQKDAIAAAEKALESSTAALQRIEAQEVACDMESTKLELEKASQDLEAIEVEAEAKGKEHREKQREANNFEKSLQEAKAGKDNNEKRLARVRKDISELRQTALKDSEGAEREALEGIDKMTQNISDAEKKQKDLRLEKEGLQDQYASGQKEANILNKRGTDLNNEVHRIESDLLSMSGSQDKAAMFGPKIPAILRQISQTRFRGEVKGPLGMHIKLKEGYEKYQVAVEKVIGRNMYSFAVSNPEDQVSLNEILTREGVQMWNSIHLVHQNRHSNVPTFPDGLTTVLDCVTVESGLVFNVLVDIVNAESVAIVSTKEEARSLTEPHPEGGRSFKCKTIKSAVLSNGTYSFRYQRGNEAYETVGGDYKRLLVKDFSEVIAHQRTVLQEKRDELAEVKSQYQHQERVLNDIKRQIDGVDSELRRLVSQIRELNRRKQDFENSLSEAQATKVVDTSDLEAEESELVDANATIDRQIVDCTEEYAQFKIQFNALTSEKQAIERRRNELKKTRDRLEDRLNNFVDTEAKHRREVEKHKTAVAAKKRDLDACVVELERKAAVRDTAFQKAEAETAVLLPDWDGTPMPARESLENINRELVKQKTLLERGKERIGKKNTSLESIRKHYETVKKRLEDEEAKFNKLVQSIEDLRNDMIMRRKKWRLTLKLNAKAINKKFKEYCHSKGWSGGIDFKHDTKTLQLVVQTDARDDTTRHEDVRQMSGGERSYTTLCLLLALGHVIECPFRVMDEYDVFLDESTRKNTLIQIRDFALTGANVHRQFFIVTPNNLKDVVTTNQVRIKEMTAPTRRALQASSAHGLHQTTL